MESPVDVVWGVDPVPGNSDAALPSDHLSHPGASHLAGKVPTPVFLPGEIHGQRSLVGYSLWGCKESDMTESGTGSPALGLCSP